MDSMQASRAGGGIDGGASNEERRIVASPHGGAEVMHLSHSLPSPSLFSSLLRKLCRAAMGSSFVRFAASWMLFRGARRRTSRGALRVPGEQCRLVDGWID